MSFIELAILLGLVPIAAYCFIRNPLLAYVVSMAACLLIFSANVLYVQSTQAIPDFDASLLFVMLFGNAALWLLLSIYFLIVSVFLKKLLRR